MKLPNGKKAVVEIAKLRDYCLSVAHPEGRHKARVFRAVLGIGPADSHMLQERPAIKKPSPAKLTDSVSVM